MRYVNYLIFILMIHLTGCSTPYVKQNPLELSPTHGYVALHLPKGYKDLYVLSTVNHNVYLLRYTGVNSLFGIWVPAGEYILSGLNSEQPLDRNNSLKFTVKSGQITNLGALINFYVGGADTVWLPKHLPTTIKLVNKLKDKLSPFLKNKNLIEWKSSIVPKPTTSQRGSSGQGIIVDWLLAESDKNGQGIKNQDLSSMLTIDNFYDTAIKELPPLEQEPAIDDIGNLYYGMDLGYIKKRNVKGEWKTINTNTYTTIIKVIWKNGVLYASNSFGLIISSSDYGQTWAKEFQLDENEQVRDLDFFENHLFVVTYKWKNLDVLKRYRDYSGSVRIYKKSVKTNKLEKIDFIELLDKWPYPFKGEISNKFYYFGIGPNDLRRWDIKNNQWINIKIPDSFRNFNVSEQDFLTVYLSGGFSSTLFVSNDEGKSWKQLDEPSYPVKDIYFFDKLHGISYRTEINFLSTDLFVQKYNATENKWVDISKTPRECKYLLNDANHFPKFCVTKSNGILSYKDTSWIDEVIK